MADKNYYDVLGLDKSASADEIKSAYRKAAMKWHPDRWANGTDEEKKTAETNFKEVAEAYSVLSDPDKKSRYDRYGSVDGPEIDMDDMFGQFGSMFGNMFSGNFGGRGNRRPVEVGDDVYVTIDLTFDEIFNGTEKTIKVKKKCTCHRCNGSGSEDNETTTCRKCNGTGMYRQIRQIRGGISQTMSPCPDCHGTGESIQNPCPDCHGTGLENGEAEMTLHIPAGVMNGAETVVRGAGNDGPHRGMPGNLHVRIHELPNSSGFTRDQANNLCYTMRVPYKTMVFGGDVNVPYVNGTQKIHIPEGTPSGKKFTLYGKGLSNEYGEAANYIVTVECNIPSPKDLDKEEKRKIKDLK